MRGLFVFTAGDAKARAHLSDSITNAVSTALLYEHLSPLQAEAIHSVLAEPSGFYAWGAVPGERNIPMWSSMKSGDIVLTVFDNHYHYISTVVSKVHSPTLAKAIWGVDDYGHTWEYMYLLTKPNNLNAHVLSSPFVDYLNKGYRGFTKISAERLNNIRQDYGSLDEFLAQAFSVQPSQTVAEQLLTKVPPAPCFDPTSIVDGRQKMLAEVVRRQGQAKFRKALLQAYNSACAVTGCDVLEVLEAAHIIPYAGAETNHVSNGILLRADIHTLFDMGELRIDSCGTIHLSEGLTQSVYGELHGKQIHLPTDQEQKPNEQALAMKFSDGL